MKKDIAIVLGFIVVIILLSCQADPNPCALSAQELEGIEELDSLISVPAIRKRERDWMKANYNEPSILDAENETYRFIWHSSFGGIRIYRIEKNDNRYQAIFKEYNHRDTTIRNLIEFDITKEVWANITDSLELNNF